MRSGAMLVLIQPHQLKRPHIGIAAHSERRPVAALVNPVFQPLIDSANAAIQEVIDEGRYALAGRSNHEFSVRLDNPHQLARYLHRGQRPPRFPPGARLRFERLWSGRRAGAKIEVTEFLTVIALRRLQ